MLLSYKLDKFNSEGAIATFINDFYVTVEIYIEEYKELYNYLIRRKGEIEDRYGKELIFTDTRGKEGQVGKVGKIYDKYNCGKTCDRSNWSYYIEWLKETSLDKRMLKLIMMILV